MRKWLISILLLLVSSVACAGEIYLHTFSKHYFVGDVDYNEENYGLSVAFNHEQHPFILKKAYRKTQIGFFNNSEGRLSTFYLEGIEYPITGDLYVGPFIGVATGYSHGPILMLAGVFVRYSFIHITVTPQAALLSFKVLEF